MSRGWSKSEGNDITEGRKLFMGNKLLPYKEEVVVMDPIFHTAADCMCAGQV